MFSSGRQCRRCLSAWIKASPNNVDNVENIFIDDKIQSILKTLTGFDLRNRIFAQRVMPKRERTHYALMNDEMLAEAMKKIEERGKHFLQFVPVKEPRLEKFEVLAKDDEIAGFDTAKYIFTDISFDATNTNRTIVVREPDGVLRTALPEEHDRMNRIFYEQSDRPVEEPALFSEPQLTNVLNENRHEFLLDYACYFFEPDSPRFIEVCHIVFDRTVRDDKLDLLYSTRHFGPLVFYLTLNNNVEPLRKFFERLKKEGRSHENILNDLGNLQAQIRRLREKSAKPKKSK